MFPAHLSGHELRLYERFRHNQAVARYPREPVCQLCHSHNRMDPAEWMRLFRATHERYKRNELLEPERARYLAMREELARSLVAAQGLTVPVGQNARKHFRISQAYAVEIANVHRTLTRDVSRAGFSAALAGHYAEGETASFSLILGRGLDPITGKVKVVSALKQGTGTMKASFAIESISEADAERLETALFDAVLGRLT